MRIILFALPGNGLGQLSEKLSDHFQLPAIFAGDIFRYKENDGSKLGHHLKSLLERGMVVPDSISTEVILERIKMDDCSRGFILSNFPNTLAQAQYLDELLERNHTPINIIVNIEEERLVLVKSLAAKSDSENITALQEKLDLYEDLARPVKAYYSMADRLITLQNSLSVSEKISEIEKFVR